jgi:hypothetical protein
LDRWNVIETDMLPKDMDELATIRARLLELGYSRAKVAGCLDFLLGKAQGDEAPMGTSSKSTYRKMLAALRSTPQTGPPDATGAASIVALAAVAGIVGTVAAAAGHLHLLDAVAPIIQVM